MKMKDLVYNLDFVHKLFGVRLNVKDIHHTEKYADFYIHFDKNNRIIGFDIKDADEHAFKLLSEYVKYKYNDIMINKNK